MRYPGSVPARQRRSTLAGESPSRSPLLFPSATGLLLDLHNWRAREWMPALDAAGVDHGTIYTLRHTAITNWLAAGLTVVEVSRYAGTSVGRGYPVTLTARIRPASWVRRRLPRDRERSNPTQPANP
jgi:integrase